MVTILVATGPAGYIYCHIAWLLRESLFPCNRRLNYVIFSKRLEAATKKISVLDRTARLNAALHIVTSLSARNTIKANKFSMSL